MRWSLWFGEVLCRGVTEAMPRRAVETGSVSTTKRMVLIVGWGCEGIKMTSSVVD